MLLWLDILMEDMMPLTIILFSDMEKQQLIQQLIIMVKKIGMIDMPCLPGSSGSPVAIINEGFYYQKNGTTRVGNRFIFLGIEVSMPCKFQDVYERDSNGEFKATKQYYYLHDLSLGNYIKSEELKGFNNIFANLGI